MSRAPRDNAFVRPGSLGKARLYQHVAEKLARAINAGIHKPGERLPAERELAASFSVSRPTVREAIIALELDGLVDVRIGSGVYVSDQKASARTNVPMDMGAFELTEARLLIEGEVAALAATLITDEELAELDDMLLQMNAANQSGSEGAELVDRQFHEAIARATRNSALLLIVQQLWTIRNRSPQCIRIFDKSRAKGNRPVVDEHGAIVAALRSRDPKTARAAIRHHLDRVLNYLLDATEIEAIEEAKAKMAVQRSRFSSGTRG